jgi:hypothetical protein
VVKVLVFRPWLFGAKAKLFLATATLQSRKPLTPTVASAGAHGWRDCGETQCCRALGREESTASTSNFAHTFQPAPRHRGSWNAFEADGGYFAPGRPEQTLTSTDQRSTSYPCGIELSSTEGIGSHAPEDGLGLNCRAEGRGGYHLGGTHGPCSRPDCARSRNRPRPRPGRGSLCASRRWSRRGAAAPRRLLTAVALAGRREPPAFKSPAPQAIMLAAGGRYYNEGRLAVWHAVTLVRVLC